MEGSILLLGLGLLCVPVLAIAAFVRSGAVRRDLEDRYQQQQSALSDLIGDVANLRRALADLKARVAAAETTKPAATPHEMPTTRAATTAAPPVTAAVGQPEPATLVSTAAAVH